MFDLAAALPLVPYVASLGSPGMLRFLVKLLPSNKVQKLRRMVDIIDKTSVEILRSKRDALQQGDETMPGRGKDLMSILRMYPR